MALLGNKLQQAYSATAKDTFNGDGSTVAFTLSRPSRTNDVEVFVENVQQEPTVAYAVSGTTLTFTEAPASGTGNIYVIHRTQATQSLTVNTDDITDGAITAAKIASGVIPDAVTKSATAPTSPVNGDLWYDTDDLSLYFYDGSGWTLVKATFVATGGTEVTDGNYKYHIFKSGTSNFTVSSGSAEIDVLLVAGGGGGGGNYYAGGGGAGGYIDTTVNVIPQSYSITVGAGGAGGVQDGGRGTTGGDTTGFNLTALGGGGGGSWNTNPIGGNGGSGGGSSGYTASTSSGTSGQGNAGGGGTTYAGGGGGGATQAGSNGNGNTSGGNGGTGVAISWITSTVATAQSIGEVSAGQVYFAGGGGGANGQNSGTHASGGLGGGGFGEEQDNNDHTAGTANTGGGGGGSSKVAGYPEGKNGGSGVVVIRYAI